MAASGGICAEFRPLKRSRLGPPDVYPQDPKQKEDELTATNVKQGFSNTPFFGDEYGTARNSNINPSRFGTYFSAIIAEKQKLNTFQDTGKRKQQISKDNFWPVTPRSRNALQAWFQDLAGNRSLMPLAKRVPIFNRKEEVFSYLCDYAVPNIRATWFIKMTTAYYAAISEAKIKKSRQVNDPSQEWTQAFTKVLRDQIHKVSEYYHSLMATGSAGFSTPPPDVENALNLWHYTTRLARYLYQEGMIERQEFLTSLVEVLEKIKLHDEGLLKLVMPLVLQYMDEFSQNQVLSRRLAYFCARKLAVLINESGENQTRCQSPHLSTTPVGNSIPSTNGPAPPPPPQPTTNPVGAMLSEYNSCPQHRSLVLSLSCVLQTITLCCPSALVWNNIGEGKTGTMTGSPLDCLPCAPSSLPLAGQNVIQHQQIRAAIRASEQQIKQRGRAVEVHWSSDKCQESTAGFTISRVLNTLEILDRHSFERCDSTNSIDSLYNKIFGNIQNKENNELPASDDPIILLLCEWAVCPQRSGEHRALVVAKLLEKRQADLEIEKNADNDILDEKESISSASIMSNGLPIFQSLLLHFLDNQAPIMDDNSSTEDKTAFSNLVLLFCELIRHDVFSHDAYMCTLISRGDLVTTPPPPPSVQSHNENLDDSAEKMEEDIQLKMEIKEEEMDEKKDDDEFSLFEPLKESRRDSSFQEKFVEALKDKKLGSQLRFKDEKNDEDSRHMLALRTYHKQSKHLLYAKHFPIPQDDMSSHECNQRLVVLYGVGKSRDEARHAVRKVQKEILKIINKKGEKENTTPSKPKKHKTDTVQSLDTVFAKFQALSYFDQHVVTTTCANNVLEQVRNFHQGTSYHLPSVDHITFIFDLMEYALNIDGLLDFAIQLLNDMSLVEAELLLKSSNLAGNYTTNLCLCIVAVLRRYHACLLLSQEQTADVFDLLCSVVKHVGNVSDCTSAERCILAYLYDLYISCSYLKAKFSEMFSNVSSKVKQTIYANIQPSASNLLWDHTFMTEYIMNPRGKQCLHSVVGRLLNDSAQNRYSLVCNALLNICNRPDTDRLNDIAALCSELTACCNALSSEWLGALKALCCSSNHDLGFNDVLLTVDVVDLSFHDSIAIFTAILISRHCFSLEDVVMHVAIPSIVNVCQSAGADLDAEPGARLTCHLLLRLFKTTYDPNDQSVSNRNMAAIKSSCDRHLLSAAHHSISVGAVLAVLKALLMLGDANVGGGSSPGLLTSLDDLSDDIFGFSNKPIGSIESAGLSDYAKYVLKMICTQDWVREKCLKDPENLCTPELLLDNLFNNKQAQHLLQLICYPNGIPTANEGNVSDSEQKQTIGRILRTLDQWTLRVSCLELQLMFKQCPASEMNTLLDNIAKATIEVFQQQTEESVRIGVMNGTAGSKRKLTTQQLRVEQERGSVWLVAPLISKLPSAVQGRVLKAAGNVLESGHSCFSSSKGYKDKDKHAQKSMSLLSHQPFLSLVLTCLKGQDEQREGLLTSLQTQLTQFLQSPKDDRWEDPKSRKMMHEALQLRLSLVGSMFDTILRSNQWTTEFALLLLQLITTGTVDIHTSGELFTTVLDMLSVLLNGTMASDMAAGQCPGEENKRQHQNLIKKLKKELGDKHSDGIDKVRQLLPLPKQSCEAITCEPMGSLIDTKGNKIAGFDSIDKKQGLQVSSKQKVIPWDMLEGHKNPAPLSWAWFGAQKLERKPLKYEEQHRLLLYHTHLKRKTSSYFLEPPPIPPDEEEPPPAVSQEAEKTTNETVADQTESKQVAEPKKKRQRQRRKTTAYPKTSEQYSFSGGRGGPMAFPQEQQAFGMPQPQGYMGVPQPASYYSQQHLGPGRLDRSTSAPTKRVLSSYLRARQPPSQTQPQMSQFHLMEKQRQQRLLQQQQQIRHQSMQSRAGENQAMFPQYKQQEQPMTHIPQPQPSSVSPNYASYGSQPPMQQPMPTEAVPPSSGMLSPTYGSGYAAASQPTPNILQQMRPNQGQYITQQPPQPQPQRQIPATAQRLQHQLQQRAGLTRSATLPAQGQSYMPQTQISQQDRITYQRQQQLLALQKQQQQQQMQTAQQQQTAALVRQLQRQMSGGVPQQHNPYQQPPPPPPSQF